MDFKIVTDSTADLPPQLAEELGITVVPAYVRFKNEVYRDRIDISEDEFYQRLLSDPIHPSTEPPTPKDFADVYQKLSQEADGIISIHISSKLSATCNSALRGKELTETECPIKVIDSQTVTMGLGLLVAAATKVSKSRNSIKQVAEEVRQNIPSIRMLGLLDTLKYLARGGRISKTRALLGSLLAIKPILTIKNGELEQVDYVRKRTDGIDKLFDFVKNTANIQDLAIVYSTTFDEAQALAERMGPIFAKDMIRLNRLGPALGVHSGPGILFIALRVK
ncbi:MAG: fatty acid-binding protein DegV [Dehalococcoidia bacterium SG8_51_3]|nr:MAG: fatty acid-binding protein DegV [Dehalococcoidia bacterium SG8_51_3]